MAQPILSIEEEKTKSNTKAIANLLPCRVHHDGPVDPIGAYWKLAQSEGASEKPLFDDDCADPSIDGTNTAYFRGRKLLGKTVALPEQYRGVVVERKADKPQNVQETAENGDEQPVEISAMQVTAGFDEMVVWGHEAVANAEADPYTRSIEEWLQVAEQVCG